MKRKTIILLAIGGALLLAGGIVYWRFRSSPQYSLLQIKGALEEANFTKFEKFVNVDGMTSSLMDQVVEILKNNPPPPEKGSLWSNLAVSMGLFDVFKPQLTLLLKPQIRRWVESGKFKTEGPFNADTPYPLPPLWQKSGAFVPTGIEFEKRDGDIAILGIGIKLARFDTVLVINLKMKNKGVNWQVEELTGLADLQDKVEKLEQQRIDMINKPVVAAFAECLKVVHFSKETSADKAHGSKTKIIVGFENMGSKAISECQALMDLSAGKQHLTREIIIDEENSVAQTEKLLPHKTVDFRFPRYGNGYDEHWLHDLPKDNLVVAVAIESIRFSDGSVIALHKKWQD